jgi:hypothetical protein
MPFIVFGITAYHLILDFCGLIDSVFASEAFQDANIHSNNSNASGYLSPA